MIQTKYNIECLFLPKGIGLFHLTPAPAWLIIPGMAHDIIRDPVKNALIKDGWTITHAPYIFRVR